MPSFEYLVLELEEYEHVPSDVTSQYSDGSGVTLKQNRPKFPSQNVGQNTRFTQSPLSLLVSLPFIPCAISSSGNAVLSTVTSGVN
jgi:hypothetical protein